MAGGRGPQFAPETSHMERGRAPQRYGFGSASPRWLGNCKRTGVIGGNPGKLSDLQRDQLVSELRAGGGATNLAARFGVSRQHVMRIKQAAGLIRNSKPTVP